MDEKKLELAKTCESLAALLAERCYTDAALREEFLANPKDVMAGIMGAPLPVDMHVVVCQKDEKHWYVAVPALEGAKELSEDELAGITAGAGFHGRRPHGRGRGRSREDRWR